MRGRSEDSWVQRLVARRPDPGAGGMMASLFIICINSSGPLWIKATCTHTMHKSFITYKYIYVYTGKNAHHTHVRVWSWYMLLPSSWLTLPFCFTQIHPRRSLVSTRVSSATEISPLPSRSQVWKISWTKPVEQVTKSNNQLSHTDDTCGQQQIYFLSGWQIW